jgi:hypothetical protein
MSIEPSNTGFYFGALLLTAALAAIRKGYVPFQVPYLAEGLALAAAGVCVFAFMNRRRFLSQLITLCILIAAATVYLFL